VFVGRVNKNGADPLPPPHDKIIKLEKNNKKKFLKLDLIIN